MLTSFVRVSLAVGCVLALGCASSGAGKTEAPPPAAAGVTQAAAPAAAEAAPKVQDGRPALVVFTKPGCPACLKLAPALAEIKKDYADKVRFEEVDTAVAKRLIFEYEISLTPTLILFVEGKEVARLLNPQPAEVRAALDKLPAAKS